MIPVDLSVNCGGGIYDSNGSGIHILGIRSRDPFSGSTDQCPKISFCLGVRVENSSPDKIARVEILEQNVCY